MRNSEIRSFEAQTTQGRGIPLVGQKQDVLGIGNALVDVVSQVSDEFLENLGLIKGAMTLVDVERAEFLYANRCSAIECSGGSAANTMVGLSMLGARVVYLGKVRQDQLGEVFGSDIRSTGVTFPLAASTSGPATGRCLVFVTPDAQRTMQTYLGASATLSPEDIAPEVIESAGMIYLEGYLFDPPPAKQAFFKAAEIARRSGRRVALSLSDAFCVDRHRSDFQMLVEQYVDVLFANEQEAVSLYQTDDLEEAASKISSCCDLAAVTLGENGSMVISGNQAMRVPAPKVTRVVDTTGAGDLYASGFLDALIRGKDPSDCAVAGNAAAAEIIRQFGARPKDTLQGLP